MTDKLHPDAQAQFDEILTKLLGLLKKASKHTNARSEFMNYDGSMGGQVLESDPPIDHPDVQISESYRAMFEQAKNGGLDLREIETLFERSSSKGPWTHRTRWITVAEWQNFKQKLAPIDQKIGLALRNIGAEIAADWYRVTFDKFPEKPRVITLHGNRVRVIKEPTSELLEQSALVTTLASTDQIEILGASWSITNEDDDVSSAIRAMRAWPTARS
jgi:hypothetical protein